MMYGSDITPSLPVRSLSEGKKSILIPSRLAKLANDQVAGELPAHLINNLSLLSITVLVGHQKTTAKKNTFVPWR